MVGSGDRYGVSPTDSGTYHLEVGGQRITYGVHFDTKEFGDDSYSEESFQ